MTASAAKFAVAVTVLRQNEGRWEVLMVARKDDHTKWSLPGGKLDPADHGSHNPLLEAEGAREAGVRELYEETGIECKPSHLVEQETILDSGGYLTTFYLLAVCADLPTDSDLRVWQARRGREAPITWGAPRVLFDGPFGAENRERFKKMGVI